MTEPWFPDAAASRAVLIGVSRYESAELPPIPAVRANLDDLRAALTDPAVGSVAASGCRVLGDDASQPDVGAALAEGSRQASDLLLVYYSGHGLLDDDGRLHLALRTTSGEHPGWTAIPIDLIKRELGRARARARVLVLDCCFSGQAVEAMAGQGGLVAGQLALTGTFTLTSTTANEPSNAPLGSRHTAFTGAFLDALAGPAPLTLEGIYRHTDDALAGLGLPRPQCRSVNTVRDLALVRGPAPSPAVRREPEPAPPPAKTANPVPRRAVPRPAAPAPLTPEVHRAFAFEPQGPAAWPKALVPAGICVVTAVIAWIAFTDPFRNASPSAFDIVVAMVFGGLLSVSALAAAVRAILVLREGARPPATPWTRLEIGRAGLAVTRDGDRREVPWQDIDRVTLARRTSGTPTIMLALRGNAILPGAPTRKGLTGLGQCAQWPEALAAVRRLAPPSVTVDRDIRALRR